MSTAQADWDDQHRRAGKSRLVYNKETRTIDTVRTEPMDEAGMAEPMSAEELLELQERAMKDGMVLASIREGYVAVPADAIRQAEQAARQDERRKVLEEAAQLVETVDLDGLEQDIASDIRALAEEVT